MPEHTASNEQSTDTATAKYTIISVPIEEEYLHNQLLAQGWESFMLLDGHRDESSMNGSIFYKQISTSNCEFQSENQLVPSAIEIATNVNQDSINAMITARNNTDPDTWYNLLWVAIDTIENSANSDSTIQQLTTILETLFNPRELQMDTINYIRRSLYPYNSKILSPRIIDYANTSFSGRDSLCKNRIGKNRLNHGAPCTSEEEEDGLSCFGINQKKELAICSCVTQKDAHDYDLKKDNQTDTVVDCSKELKYNKDTIQKFKDLANQIENAQ
jgi:hypothetical protein